MVRILQTVIALIFITAVALPQGVEHSFPRVRTNSIKAYPDSNLTIKDTLRLNYFVKGDSTSIPATPSYGQGHLIFRGNLGIFYQYPNGSLRNLDSLSTYVDSARAASIADSAKKVSNSYARGLLSASAPLSYNSSTGAFTFAHNTTNLQITASQLNTIQDIHTGASDFTVAGATIKNALNKRGLLVWDGTNVGSKIGFQYATVNPVEPFLTHNLGWNGTSWTADRTTIGSHAIKFTSGGAYEFYSQASGTGLPVTPIASFSPTSTTLSHLTTDGGILRHNTSGVLTSDVFLKYLNSMLDVGDATSVDDPAINIYNRNGFYARILSQNLTSDLQFQFPDTAGTLQTQENAATFYAPLASPPLTGTTTFKNGATSAGKFQIYEDSDDGSNYTQFSVPAMAANITYTLPADDGDAGEQLQTNGTGTLTWEAAGSGSGAPTDATYITQTANGTLSAEQALGALATGILKNTTTTGVLSIAAQGTDYYAPSGTDVAVADGGTGASTAAGARTNLEVKKTTIITTTSNPYSLTTAAGEIVVVQAVCDNTFIGLDVVYLKYNSVTKDTKNTGIDGLESYFPVALQYSETPGAATANVEIVASGGTLENVKIIITVYTP